MWSVPVVLTEWENENDLQSMRITTNSDIHASVSFGLGPLKR